MADLWLRVGHRDPCPLTTACSAREHEQDEPAHHHRKPLLPSQSTTKFPLAVAAEVPCARHQQEPVLAPGAHVKYQRQGKRQQPAAALLRGGACGRSGASRRCTRRRCALTSRAQAANAAARARLLGRSPRFGCGAGPVLRARCPRRSPTVPLANAVRASFGVPGRQSMALAPSRDWPNPEARHIACDACRETATAFRLGPRPSPRGRLRRRAGAPRRPLGLAAAPAAASRSAAAPPRQRFALMACARSLWSSARCFLSGGGRRRAALAAPLPAAPRWRS